MQGLHSTRDSRTMDLDIPGLLDERGILRTKSVQTRGLFHFIQLPPEIRVKIYNILLISPEVICIGSENSGTSRTAPKLPYPPVSLLRTCKKIDEEATPILYGKNDFTICLPIDPSPTFLLSKFRWSTLRILKSLTFTSSNGPAPSLSLTEAAFSAVGFHCTGTEILARFHPSDFRYSPIGPDHFMALSISNWISTKVMSAQLTAIQKELELMMGPYDDVLAALAPPAPN